jgi:hypothetical protein
MSFEICALLDDTLVIAMVKATHRLEVRPSFLMEILLGPTPTTGSRVRVLEADLRVISKRGRDTSASTGGGTTIREILILDCFGSGRKNY